jgi:peptidoglycan/xylan/chitin deacetylase (PgdA/CDA1 family)
MNRFKHFALTSYYWASLPARRLARVRRIARGREPVQILFYHRVADEHPNDWTMSRKTFEKQIDWLRAHFDLVSMAEAQARIAAGQNHRPTVCLTFDDGYADNMRFAVPLLLKHRIPFTYFVTTGHLLSGKPFPHDVKAGRPLAPNTIDQLRRLVAAGVEIGGHTRSHADAGRLSHDELVQEISGCKGVLEDAMGCNVRYFAFPYGLHQNMSTDAFLVAREAGYDGVCSAYGGYNFPGDDPFHLRRIHADPDFIRLRNWLTIDRRKLRKHHDFDPGDYCRSDSKQSPRQPVHSVA